MKKTSNKLYLAFIALILIAISVVFFVGKTFAWFSFNFKVDQEQVLTGAFFEIDLQDTIKDENGIDRYLKANSINIEEGYPISDSRFISYRTDATKQTEYKKQLYKLKVYNIGTIAVMYKFDVEIDDVTFAGDTQELSKQLKYSIRYSDTEFVDNTTGWSTPYFLIGTTYVVNGVTYPNISLQQNFNNILITPVTNEYTTFGYLKGRRTNKQDEGKFFEINIWIDSSATQESTTYTSGAQVIAKKTELNLVLTAMQSTAIKW